MNDKSLLRVGEGAPPTQRAAAGVQCVVTSTAAVAPLVDSGNADAEALGELAAALPVRVVLDDLAHMDVGRCVRMVGVHVGGGSSGLVTRRLPPHAQPL